ncbi:hypothetical protein D3C77_564720 [compost metagenome]
MGEDTTGLSEGDESSGSRVANVDLFGGFSRQWAAISLREAICCVAGFDATRTFQWRQTTLGQYQQTG